jgi:hypothetical protein
LVIPLGFLTAGVAAPAHAAGTGHYVDCSRNTDGTGSQASPWNSLSSVNAAAFGPGDSILFARGTTCTGALHPAGSGSATATITVDAYGTGALPVIDDSTAADPAAVALTDQSYWDIQNLEIVGGQTYGVHVTGNTANAALHHVHLTDLDVHGATGTSTKRGDSGEVFIYPDAGGETISDVVVNGVTAHDSHVSQGIYIAGAFGAFPAGTVVASPPNGPTGTGVTVENSTAHDVYGDSTSATVYLWNPTGNTATVRGDDFTLASGWPSWTGTLVSSVAANKCLDIPSSSTTNGSRADISDCTGGANQTFTHTATGALRVYSGSNLKCLDDFNASKSPGAAVGIWTCDSGANQQWVLNPDGTITSPLSGLCLDVTGNKSTNGTPVELWTCTGSANQKWTAQ